MAGDATQHVPVSYPVNAPRAEKVKALYAGLETIAERLLLDYGQPLANVLAGLDSAGKAAVAVAEGGDS